MRKHGADLSIIIPAAGVGRRMRSHGSKSLIEIFGKVNLINYQITLLRKVFPRSEIVVVVGFQADKVIRSIEDKSIKVVENELYETTGVARSIELALRTVSHPNILIVYGDLVFNQMTVNNINGNTSCVIIDNVGQMDKEEVGLTSVNEEATYFSYGLDTKWAQILFIKGKELEMFKNLLSDKTKRKLQTFEFLNKLIEQGGKLKVVEPKFMNIVEIDSNVDIEKAKAIL